MKNFSLDSLKSLIGNLGNSERDKRASLVFEDQYLSDQQLIAAYSSNWIARKIIDIPARDSLRKWRVWGGEHGPAIKAEEKRLGVQGKLVEALTKARLFGGAAVYIGTDQQSEEELDIDAISNEGIQYLTVMGKYELQAGQLETDPFSPFYGQPRDYQISGDNTLARIHPSRLVIFQGNRRPDTWISQVRGDNWAGDSVLRSTHDAIKNAGGSFSNVASLVFEANIDVIGIPQLMAQVGNAGQESNVLKRFALAAIGKGNHGTLILDAEETYERKSTSFAQLPEIMREFAMHCAAAEDIPATRFLAQSPGGLQSTGDSDMKNYHDRLQSMQRLDIEPAICNLDRVLVRSALGDEPEDATYDWSPFEQMSEKELADIGKTTLESLKILNELDAFLPQEIRELATYRLAEVGAFPNIEQIIQKTSDITELLAELEPEPDPVPGQQADPAEA